MLISFLLRPSSFLEFQIQSPKEGHKKGREKSRPMKDQSNLIFVLHLFLMLLDQCLLDIVRHELIA